VNHGRDRYAFSSSIAQLATSAFIATNPRHYFRVLKADVRSHRPIASAHRDDDLDLGRAAVDEEFDAVDET
jgi:hypothetical protein